LRIGIQRAADGADDLTRFDQFAALNTAQEERVKTFLLL
jgi:hypothetical protein